VFINVTTQIGGGGGTPPSPSSKCSEPSGSINPFDWLRYWACILSNTATGLYQALSNLKIPTPADISTALGNAWTSIFTEWADFWNGLKELLTDPSAFVGRAVQGVIKEASPSVLDDFYNALLKFFQTASTLFKQTSIDHPTPPVKPFQAIEDLGAQIGQMIAQPTNPDSVQAALHDLDLAVSQVFLSLMTGQQLVEDIPTLNKTGTANFALSWLEGRGMFDVIRGTIQPYLTHNTQLQLEYHLNEFYKNRLADLNTLINLYNKGYYSLGVLDQQGPRVSGLDAETIHQIQKSTRAIPGLDEFVTYNLRHPDTPINWSQLEDLLGLDFTRYGPVFNERQYADISLRFVQGAFDILDLSEPQIREMLRLTRLDPRPNAILQQSPLDIAVKVVMGRKAETVGLKALTAKTQAYLRGLATLQDVEELAKSVYASQQSRDWYLSYIQDEAKVHPPKAKHFGYALLIKLAESGQDITPFMDDDLKAEGWDDAHRAALESYVQSVIQAKSAKTSTGTTASSPTG
jgi:hypothetical protein